MTHLDEGTVHAWLDGALSAAEARDADAHVATCAECSAKVAEARGFVAGASRILTALDDVPAGVTPKRAPSTTPAMRQWRAAPWVTGIAATLVLAIGVATWRKQPQEFALRRSTQPPAPVALADSARAIAPQPSAVRPVAQQPPTSPPAVLRRDAAAADLRQRALLDAQANVASGAGARLERAPGRVSALGDSLRAEPGAAADVTSEVKKLAAEVAPTPAPRQMKSASSIDANTATLSALNLAGCYPIEPSASGRLGAAADVLGKTVAPRPEATARRAAVAPSGAPAAGLPGPPPMLLLDTARHPRGFVARLATTREPIGSWDRIDGDSVRVDLLVRGLYTIWGGKRVACAQP